MIVGTLATGVAFIYTTGNIDFSVGSVMGLACVFGAMTYQATNNMWLMILVTLLCGVLLMMVNCTLGVTFKVFEAIGGFLFSLKGKWGMFCVVVSIIIVVINSINLLGIFGGGKDALTIVANIIDAIIAILFCVACIKHRKENQALALEETKAN